MKKFRLSISVLLISAIALIGFAGSLQVLPNPVLAHNGNPHLVRTFIGPDGQEIDELIFPVKPPAVKEKPVKVPQPNLQMGINYVSGLVPAFDWSYGCSATSAAMLFGYYDRVGYSNMYTGPTNSGVCPETNYVWGTGESPLSATHLNVDDRTERGHVDDYWVTYLDPGPDPYVVEGWTEHTLGDCTGDYMGTNQAKYGNVDGGTTFYFYTDGSPLYDYTGSEPDSRDGGHGMKLFAESREYDVITTFNQYIRGQGTSRFRGFTFANYVSEIDAGRPVLIQVSGHTMLGFGYNTTGNLVYLHDTWDYATHTMTWGGSYAGMQHYGVTVFRLAASPAPIAAFTGSPTSGIVPLTVNFTDQSTNSPISWAWDFDNNGTIDSYAQNPSYTYTVADTYTVRLTVTNAYGSNDEIKANYINVSAQAAPVAAFTGSPTSGIAPLTVNFIDQSTNSPTSWAWDFDNDGEIDSTLQNPPYTYTKDGTYTVGLTVTNDYGRDYTSKTNYIIVNPAPIALITVISPNGGESWISGKNNRISWSSSGVIGNVKIELSRDSGAHWTTIADSTANDGKYNWRVTPPTTTQARVKVSSVIDPSVFDVSDADFTIR